MESLRRFNPTSLIGLINKLKDVHYQLVTVNLYELEKIIKKISAEETHALEMIYENMGSEAFTERVSPFESIHKIAKMPELMEAVILYNWALERKCGLTKLKWEFAETLPKAERRKYRLFELNQDEVADTPGFPDEIPTFSILLTHNEIECALKINEMHNNKMYQTRRLKEFFKKRIEQLKKALLNEGVKDFNMAEALFRMDENLKN